MANFAKYGGISLVVGILVFGLVGQLLADETGRYLGGGLGAAVGLIVGSLLARWKTGS